MIKRGIRDNTWDIFGLKDEEMVALEKAIDRAERGEQIILYKLSQELSRTLKSIYG